MNVLPTSDKRTEDIHKNIYRRHPQLKERLICTVLRRRQLKDSPISSRSMVLAVFLLFNMLIKPTTSTHYSALLLNEMKASSASCLYDKPSIT